MCDGGENVPFGRKTHEIVEFFARVKKFFWLPKESGGPFKRQGGFLKFETCPAKRLPKM